MTEQEPMLQRQSELTSTANQSYNIDK